ncbi:integrase [Francisella halioticida]|uniref:tyrosine-type recombinase/integrase n=1 Tax=Francisella halioticida TaxID=549298 RepID=UPI001AF3A198|nr:integrase arm-type DNA-binding domain-containing protein [Francisella halioticida]BCD91203.1 integrase [Francisella halioticida]
MAGKLTVTKIQGLKNTGKDYRIADGNGLYLKVSKTGSKSWQFRHKNRWTGLGSYPDVSLKKARLKIGEFKEAIADGVSPQIYKKTLESESHSLFCNIVDFYLNHKIANNDWTSESTRKKNINRLNNKVKPVFANRQIDKIKPIELANFIKSFTDTPSEQEKVYNLLNGIYSFAVSSGYHDTNPVRELNAIKTNPKNERYPFINPIMQRAIFSNLLNDIDNYKGQVQTVKALQILPYVAFRPSMLTELKWSEVYLDNNNHENQPHILVAKERMKSRRDFAQPLSKPAVKILEAMKAINGTKEFVFSSTKGKPLDINTLRKSIQNKLGYNGKDKPKQTTHGFRHIVSTILYSLQNKYKWSDTAIETVLDHEAQNKVQATYNIYSYFKERVEMINVLADYVDDVKANSNIINIDNVS